MTITRLKAKHQLTIPTEVVKKLHLKTNELFAVEVEGNFIKLTPVEMEPRYTPEELGAMDRLVAKEKHKAKVFQPGKEFSAYIKKTVR